MTGQLHPAPSQSQRPQSGRSSALSWYGRRDAKRHRPLTTRAEELMSARSQLGAAVSRKISVTEPVSAPLLTARACSTQAGLSVLQQSGGIRLRGWRLIPRVFLPFTAAFFLSYLFRTINAVISSELSSELALDAADLGFLTSVYFLTFAALQLPVGIWLDRYGPRRVQGPLLLFPAVCATPFS